MVSSTEYYPSLTPQNVEGSGRYEQQLRKTSDEIICDMGAIALAGFNRPPSADQFEVHGTLEAHDTFEVQDSLEAQFAMESIPDHKRNTLRTLGSVATLSHYEEMLERSLPNLNLEHATLGYADQIK